MELFFSLEGFTIFELPPFFVMISASAGYSYPQQPSAFYPGSRYPGHVVAPPPYTAGTQPAYPPTFSDQSQGAPPPLSGLYSSTQTTQPSAPNGFMNTNKVNQPYGGYGTGES